MREPSEEKLALMKHWKFVRQKHKIPLRIVAQFSGYSLQYLKTIESGYDTISDNVIKAYQKAIEIFENNTPVDVKYTKLSDK